MVGGAISKHRGARRRGSVFLPLLLIATVSATLTIGGLLVVQSHSRSVQIRLDTTMARANAVSAIEVARAKIAADTNWRLNHVNGTWVANELVVADGSQGTYSVSVENPFGTLSRSESDSVVITGVGVKGTASQTMSVTLLPAEKIAYTCLTAAIAAAGNIYLTGTDVDSATTTSLLAANGDVIAGTPQAAVGTKMTAQAVGVISGARFNGTNDDWGDGADVSRWGESGGGVSNSDDDLDRVAGECGGCADFADVRVVAGEQSVWGGE